MPAAALLGVRERFVNIVGDAVEPVSYTHLDVYKRQTLTNCDEQWKWQKYAFALPVSRAQIVRARYLAAGALAGIGFAASLAINAAAALAFSAYPPVLHLLLAAASLGLTLFALALVLPAGLSRGANAGFAAMFAVILALLVLFGAAGFSACLLYTSRCV